MAPAERLTIEHQEHPPTVGTYRSHRPCWAVAHELALKPSFYGRDKKRDDIFARGKSLVYSV